MNKKFVLILVIPLLTFLGIYATYFHLESTVLSDSWSIERVQYHNPWAQAWVANGTQLPTFDKVIIIHTNTYSAQYAALKYDPDWVVHRKTYVDIGYIDLWGGVHKAMDTIERNYNPTTDTTQQK